MRQSKILKTHEPVLLKEVLEALQVEKLAHLNTQARFIDATVGSAGHAVEIIKKGISVLGIDADRKMLEIAEKQLVESLRHQDYGGLACPDSYPTVTVPFKLVQGNFRDIDRIAQGEGFTFVDGILFDLGVSSLQLTSQERGFSFQYPDVPLDMRIDENTQRVTAADLLNVLSQKQLTALFNSVLGIPASKKLSRSVVYERQHRKIKTVGDFTDIIRGVGGGKKGLHYATLPFLALRIAVNSELENLEVALPKAFDLLKKQGRLAVISFHSGEDRIVKKFYKSVEIERKGALIYKKPQEPKQAEIEANPRARSAKLRVLEKL